MKVWLYARLSRDEDDEMNSLNNQRQIVREYAEKMDYEVVGESFDDNVSGMTFDREGIRKIAEQVEKKTIDAVLVKDMSRLGRHKTDTAVFIEYLRRNDIRVISATENLDTSRQSDDLVISFKGLINDYYAREGSEKVRIGMDNMLKKGLIITPPMGYFKDKNTNKIVVIEEQAAIIRRIFDLYLYGYGCSAIAHLLNDNGIKSPAYYQKIIHGKRLGWDKPEISSRFMWDHSSVKRILCNKFYIGTVVCHKTYNNKITHIRKDIPKEEQYVHENLVTPIISKEKFEQVQRLMEQKKKMNVRAGYNKPYHRYAGLLECGDCGSSFSAVNRKWNGEVRVEYVCNGYHRYGNDNCSSHRIHEEELDEIIYGEIKNLREQAERIYANIDGEVRKWLKKKSTVTGKVKQLNADLEQRKSDQKEILLERIRDKEHAEVYDEMLTACESDIEKLQQEINELENYSETIKKRKSEMKRTIDLIEEIIKEGEISDVNLRMLVEKIKIYDTSEGLRIEVRLNADFTEHMIIFNKDGEKQADIKVLEKGNYPLAMRRRMRFKE